MKPLGPNDARLRAAGAAARLAPLLLATSLAVLGTCFGPDTSFASPPASCAIDTIGLDVSLSVGSGAALLGEALGQSLLVHDTQLEFFSVWRVVYHVPVNNIGMHPYIVETTATGLPDPSRIVWDGPILVIPGEDGVHPTEFKWTFDPPLVLPHPGLYAFFIFENPCSGVVDLRTTNLPDDYAEGEMWTTERSNCVLRNPMAVHRYSAYDLAFQMGFCPDFATPARRSTWGELKLLYR